MIMYGGERMGWAGAGSARPGRDKVRSSIGEQGEGSWKREDRDGTRTGRHEMRGWMLRGAGGWARGAPVRAQRAAGTCSPQAAWRASGAGTRGCWAGRALQECLFWALQMLMKEGPLREAPPTCGRGQACRGRGHEQVSAQARAYSCPTAVLDACSATALGCPEAPLPMAWDPCPSLGPTRKPSTSSRLASVAQLASFTAQGQKGGWARS